MNEEVKPMLFTFVLMIVPLVLLSFLYFSNLQSLKGREADMHRLEIQLIEERRERTFNMNLGKATNGTHWICSAAGGAVTFTNTKP